LRAHSTWRQTEKVNYLAEAEIEAR